MKRVLWIVSALTVLNLALVGVALTRETAGGAPGEATVLRGERLELVDQDGKVRFDLHTEESGEAVLRLTHADGSIGVKLGAGDDGSGLVLIDDEHEPGVQMISRAGETQITLKDEGRAEEIAP